MSTALSSLSLTRAPSTLSGFVFLAQESDAKEICEVVNTAYLRDSFRGPPRTTYEKICGYFRDGKHSWYVIRLPNNRGLTEIAATVLYSQDNADETPAEGNIHMLAARSEHVKKGLSEKLLNALEERAKQEGKKEIALIVVNTNPKLKAKYESLGYQATGKIFDMPARVIKAAEQKIDPKSGKFTIFCHYMIKKLTNFNSEKNYLSSICNRIRKAILKVFLAIKNAFTCRTILPQNY